MQSSFDFFYICGVTYRVDSGSKQRQLSQLAKRSQEAMTRCSFPFGNQRRDFAADDIEIGDLKKRLEVVATLTGLGRHGIAERVLKQHG